MLEESDSKIPTWEQSTVPGDLMQRPLIPIVIFYIIGLLMAHYQMVSVQVVLSAAALCFVFFALTVFFIMVSRR